jgi:hypothetical protein
MTAYYSNTGTVHSNGRAAIGNFMKNNAPISNGTFGNISSAFQQRLSVASTLKEDDEAEMVETQIGWFEQTRMDLKKKNRYANSNLHEVFNYEEKLAKHIEEKKRDKKK